MEAQGNLNLAAPVVFPPCAEPEDWPRVADESQTFRGLCQVQCRAVQYMRLAGGLWELPCPVAASEPPCNQKSRY